MFRRVMTRKILIGPRTAPLCTTNTRARVGCVAQHTSDWDLRFRTGDTPWEDDAVAPCVVELVQAHARVGARVLEIGCGRGTTSLWLARRAYRVVAVDVSPHAIDIVRQRAEAAGLGIQ